MVTTNRSCATMFCVSDCEHETARPSTRPLFLANLGVDEPMLPAGENEARRQQRHGSGGDEPTRGKPPGLIQATLWANQEVDERRLPAGENEAKRQQRHGSDANSLNNEKKAKQIGRKTMEIK